MKFVPGGQGFTGEERHPLDSRQETLNGCGSVSATLLIIEGFDDQADALVLMQAQFLFGFENSVCVDGFSNLSHFRQPLP
jgi:hypothetical protein